LNIEKEKMKTIGLIGGMSWESAITYYEILNKEVIKALGCAETGMLISKKDSALPARDTTIIHTKDAVKPALE
jgi:aspartate/glutamate racemase